jgi:hypothetical protein
MDREVKSLRPRTELADGAMAFAGTWTLEGPGLLAQPAAPAISIDAAVAKKFPQIRERD